MPESSGHTHTQTHTVFNIYWFYTAAVVTRTRSVLLHTYVASFVMFLLDFPQKTGIMMSDRVNERAAKDDLIIRCL